MTRRVAFRTRCMTVAARAADIASEDATEPVDPDAGRYHRWVLDEADAAAAEYLDDYAADHR